MSDNVKFLMVVGGILALLIGLFLWDGQLIHQGEEELARLTEEDEQTRIARNETDEYLLSNRRQQIGILITGSVLILVAVVWRIGLRNRTPE